MALRYLAGRIGGRASGSRLAQPAGTPGGRALGSRLAQPAGTPRRLSSSHQGGHDNGARKPSTDADMAAFVAECEAIREAFKQEQKNKRVVVWTCLTGVGMAMLTMWHAAYTEIERTRYLKAKMLK